MSVLCKNASKIMEKINATKDSLNRILAKQEPPYGFPPSIFEGHERMQYNAKKYLDEIAEITFSFNSNHDILLVTKDTMVKMSNSADFSEITFDGTFCKIMCLNNWPSEEPKWLIWLAPLSSV